MSKNEDTIASIIGFVFAAVILAIPFAMLLLLFPFKKPLIKLFGLEERSLNWKWLRWFLHPLKWCMVPGFAYCAWQTLLTYQSTGSLNQEAVITAIPYLVGCLLCAMVYCFIQWMQDHYHSPAVQKRIAGIQAEQFVQTLIDKNLDRYSGSQALHGALFVFNRGLSNEFSVEADHILVTQKYIYMIETKYRSGTIAALAAAPHWKVSSPQGETRMRNALQQAKNSAGVLSRECRLPCKVIPLVAITGNDVKLTDAPANVVQPEELFNIIDAFEFGSHSAQLDPPGIITTLTHHIFTDKQSVANHIARANLAKARLKMRDIVRTSSIE